MRILLSGATGLIGSEARRRLETRGDSVVAIARGPREGAVSWPEGAPPDASALEGFDAVVHLAGESVAGRWSAAKKARIYDSRVTRTRQLCDALATLKTPPRVLVCASAIGIYGDRGGETLDENSASGSGFLADTCRDWEAASAPVESKMRVAHARFGIVLSRRGGALKEMLLPFNLGLGGPLGDGSQFWSWITLSDAARAVLHLLDGEICGPANITAPDPVRNREFARDLGSALHRVGLLPVPAFALRLLFGEFADEGLLSSARAMPKRLQGSGFRFEQPYLLEALDALFHEARTS